MRIGYFINPIARLREGHVSGIPDPAVAAALAESAGIQIILAGWAQSSGLLTERDILMTRELVHGDLIVVAPLKEDLVDTVLKFHPDGIVLVDGSWDGVRPARPILVEADTDRIATAASAYKSAGIPAALMIEPNAQAVKTMAKLNISGVVLDCTNYASARNEKDAGTALDRISDAALAAGKFGLMAAAAHGLTAQNFSPVAAVRYIEEIYFGQWISSRALFVGLDRACREVLASPISHRNG